MNLALLVALAPSLGGLELSFETTSGNPLPGARVAFDLVAEIRDVESAGLASFSFDLEADGAVLEPLEPAFPEADRFSLPLGFTNPGGLGGTELDGRRVQVGGAQNTVALAGTNSFAGEVEPGVAAKAPVVLFRGALTLPEAAGSVRLAIRDARANHLLPDSSPEPYWSVGALPATSLDLVFESDGRRVVVREEPAPDVAAVLELQPRMGEPLPGLTRAEYEGFVAGKLAFGERLTNATGLGPIFNDRSCQICHALPAAGGFSAFAVTRFGRRDGDTFDPMLSHGGSLLQHKTISVASEEFVPPEANVTARRITPQLFGSGLVEALPDSALAETPERAGSAGWTRPVELLEGGEPRLGRFGWKAQLATLLSFSADAALNEMGLTNRLLPVENAPNGSALKLEMTDRVADPEDVADEDGLALIDRVTTFQQFLAPPPQTPRAGMRGEAIFESVGCAKCHRSEFTTPVHPSRALSEVTFRPYGDFLLHDVGALADGIEQGAGTAKAMRTAPLWGVSQKVSLLHDGRSTGGEFGLNVVRAVSYHDGEAAEARDAFRRLSESERSELVAFLGSLGRAEFDADNDNDVDAADWSAVEGWVTGPGAHFTPDDPRAVADVDADGDVDLVDVGVFLRAFTGS